MPPQKNNSPTMLIILDGFGYKKDGVGNAIDSANMPNWKKWINAYPNTLIKAAGSAVGLPPECIGNSEVGHTCMGSGRIVKTVITKLNEEIKNKSLFKNKILLSNFEKLKKNNNALHLMGLLSDAGVHSHQNHLYAFIKLASIIGLKKVFIHAFLDGRDVPPKSASKFLEKLEKECNRLNCGKIASLHGRFYAMDRDNNWDRIALTYNVLCNKNKENSQNLSWQKVLKDSYAKDITDEFIRPILLIKNGAIKQNDGILFFNFRPDRAQELTQCFINPEFNKFKTMRLNSTTKTLAFFISITRYKKEFAKFNNEVLFEKEEIKHTLLDEIAEQTNGKKVFIIAETEKYAHVTYFFRGMIEKQLANETYKLIPSIKTRNYIKYPEMSAEKITLELLKSLQTDPAYFYLVNYANADMVGHSGNIDATIKACECLDKQLGTLYKQVIEKQNGTLFITADHGNAEEMIDLEGNPKTAHTKNPVVFMVINKNLKKKGGKEKIDYNSSLGIANIAPTILKYLGLKIPKEMEQKTIFSFLD